jgi:hypothetical protein
VNLDAVKDEFSEDSDNQLRLNTESSDSSEVEEGPEGLILMCWRLLLHTASKITLQQKVGQSSWEKKIY